jgi:hypothetical protein
LLAHLDKTFPEKHFIKSWIPTASAAWSFHFDPVDWQVRQDTTGFSRVVLQLQPEKT